VLSMAGVASVRYAVEHTATQPPLTISESPLDHSRVATPEAGFSLGRLLSGRIVVEGLSMTV
jgi:hypothetical protein